MATKTRFAPLKHLAYAAGIVAGLELIRQLEDGAGWARALGELPDALVFWAPILAGVAIAIRTADRLVLPHALGVAAVVLPAMLMLDMVGASVSAGPSRELAITAGQTMDADAAMFRARRSMLGTAWLFTSGVVGSASEVVPDLRYPLGHPRRLAAAALFEANLLLIVFGALGAVVLLGRLARSQVTFASPIAERVGHILAAWCLCPVLVWVVLGVADDAQVAAMRGSSPPATGGLGGAISTLLPLPEGEDEDEVGEEELSGAIGLAIAWPLAWP